MKFLPFASSPVGAWWKVRAGEHEKDDIAAFYSVLKEVLLDMTSYFGREYAMLHFGKIRVIKRSALARLLCCPSKCTFS